jgi:hypothetical protein
MEGEESNQATVHSDGFRDPLVIRGLSLRRRKGEDLAYTPPVSIALSLTELSRKSSSEPARRAARERTASGDFLLLTSGALVFIVLPPDDQKFGYRASVDPVVRTPFG